MQITWQMMPNLKSELVSFTLEEKKKKKYKQRMIPMFPNQTSTS